jgi:hypothetical protein
MALALRELQSDYLRQPAKERPSLANFNYARKDMAEQLMAKISSLRFQGASGLVSFSGADRIGTTSLFQIQSEYNNRTNPIMGNPKNGFRGDGILSHFLFYLFIFIQLQRAWLGKSDSFIRIWDWN